MTDVTVNTLGLVIAAISVVASGMQQILCGVVQRRHKINSHQLLSNTAPVQVCCGLSSAGQAGSMAWHGGKGGAACVLRA